VAGGRRHARADPPLGHDARRLLAGNQCLGYPDPGCYRRFGADVLAPHPAARQLAPGEKEMPEYRRLKDRVAIVTGGARGIGAAIAGRLAAEGARVLIADIDIEEAKATARRLGQQTGGNVVAQHTDITNPAHAAAAA